MKKALLVLMVLALVGAGGVAWTLYMRTSEPFKGYEGNEQFVVIESGSGTRTIGQRLIDAGVIRDDVTFRAAVWRSGRARGLQAGEFRFDRPMTPFEPGGRASFPLGAPISKPTATAPTTVTPASTLPRSTTSWAKRSTATPSCSSSCAAAGASKS